MTVTVRKVAGDVSSAPVFVLYYPDAAERQPELVAQVRRAARA